MDTDNDTDNQKKEGLAAFQVSGDLPAAVTDLSFESASLPGSRDELILLGFTAEALRLEVLTRRAKGVDGALLLLDQGIGEGFSGGPVLQSGVVVGVVTGTDNQSTYALKSEVALATLKGWKERCCVHVHSCEEDGEEPPNEVRTEGGIDFVRISPGSFTMGSPENDWEAKSDEKPAHKVTLSEFWLGKTEVTNGQYRRFRPDHRAETELPVTNVSWTDANAACQYFGGRLPTEAEWEYAARAGCQATWSFGCEKRRLVEYAWHAGNSNRRAHPVGEKRPNKWGLYDMHGNVWEWVADRYGTYSRAAQADPSGPVSGTLRVLRGGGFDPPTFTRSTERSSAEPSARGSQVGFRCAYDPNRPGHSPSRRQRSKPAAPTLPLSSQ